MARPKPTPMRIPFPRRCDGPRGVAPPSPTACRTSARTGALDFVVVNAENATAGRGPVRRPCAGDPRGGAPIASRSAIMPSTSARCCNSSGKSRASCARSTSPRTRAGAGARVFRATQGRQVLVTQALGQGLHETPLRTTRSRRSMRRSGKYPRGGTGAGRPSSTSMPRRPRRRWPPAISATAAPVSWSAPTPMCPRRTR